MDHPDVTHDKDPFSQKEIQFGLLVIHVSGFLCDEAFRALHFFRKDQ